MRIDSIRLQNYRCFKDESFELKPRFNLVVGDNATGKTSLLHGISIAVGTLFRGFPEPAESFSLDRDVARTETFWHAGKANVEAQYPILIDCEGVVDDKPTAWERQLSKGGRTTWRYSGRLQARGEWMAAQVAANEPVVLPVLAFYGTGRIWKQKRFTEVKTLSPGSRFLGYLNCLDPASDEKRLLEWFKTRELVALQKKQSLADLEAVRKAIRTCVHDANELYWDFAADQLAIRFDKRIVWFRQLSDGYRNMLGMVADIAERCVTLNPQLGDQVVAQTPGVVLIDEIDLHLHPKWQRRVVGDLLQAFPKIQFVATTHSPFIIQSLPLTDEVQLLNLDDAEATDYANKSVEDITEQVQGAGEQTRSEHYKEMMAAAEEYYRALERADRTPEQLQLLKDRLDELASRYSDDPAYHAILKVEREARLGRNGDADAPG